MLVLFIHRSFVAVVPKKRHTISAPGRKVRASQGPQLPQINTLVADQLTKDTETSGTRITRRDVPPHAKAVRKTNGKKTLRQRSNEFFCFKLHQKFVTFDKCLSQPVLVLQWVYTCLFEI